ncbi:MAG: M20 metallopeptidase family protein [Terrisporobacter sp.]|uniref:M20 metallopeptidase family protein n=1 Tax=Terrisporobacter sp. TaxID=1965305 RepID=UPI0025DBBE4A|nr:amidohydrolase [uncultured Terrisporobacter sp.]
MGITYLEQTMKNHRHNLHSLAELSHVEFKTAKYIRDYLDKLGVEYETLLETATVGIIKGKNPKKTIAFRSDIDALPSPKGAEHLCGHDGHMSILLGLIEYIVENKEKLNDNIVFIFQPAEEDTGGAERLVKAGVLKKYNVDEIYGLHIHPDFEEGYVGCKAGYLMAQNGEFNIDIIGKGGHGAIPQNATDAVLIGADFVTSLQSIISRNIDPMEGAVLTIGKISGGTARNIIAEKVRLEGTMRCFNPQVYDEMINRIKAFSKGFEASYNCKVDVELIDGYLSVNNDEKLFDEFVKAIGKEKIVKTSPLMISEDFSFYQREVPGLFFMLGARNEEKGYVNALHNLNFNFNEDILINGLKIYESLLKYKKSIEL